MRVEIQLRILGDDDTVLSDDAVLRLDKAADQLAAVGLESTVNVVVDKSFAKKQQMQWSKVGAHRMVQVRTRTLDGTLRKTFTAWYPGMAANDSPTPAAANAA